MWVKHLSVKRLELKVELRFFHSIFRCFSPTKEASMEILCSVTLDFRKIHVSSVSEFIVVGENENGVLLGEWPKLLMSGDPRDYCLWTLIQILIHLFYWYFCGREIVIFFELTIIPTNSISRIGVITDIFWFRTNPNRRVTREGREGVSPALFRKFRKRALVWRKIALSVVIYG